MNATCKTFATPAEAAAFMMGFQVAQRCTLAHVEIEVRPDPEEPQCILADLTDDAEEIWLDEARTFNQTLISHANSNH